MIMELDLLVGEAQYVRCIAMKVNLVTIQNVSMALLTIQV
jgi:hypothetical protein